jgi:hypothetical protein
LPLVEFPKTNNVTNPKRLLRLLLLSPNNMSEERLSATIERTQHFIALTGGLDVAIVLSLSTSKPFSSAKDLLSAPELEGMEGLRSYALLQAQFMTRSELAWVPILPLAKLDGIVELIKTHAQSISRPKPKPSSAIRPLDMLAHCSYDPPLPPLAVNLASDVFSSLRDVAQAALAHYEDPAVHDSGGITSSDDSLRSDRYGFTVLKEQLDTEVIKSMVDFWVGDWSVD